MACAGPAIGSGLTFFSSVSGLVGRTQVQLLWKCSKSRGGCLVFVKVLWVCYSYQCYCLRKTGCYASNFMFSILHTIKLAIIKAQFIHITLFSCNIYVAHWKVIFALFCLPFWTDVRHDAYISYVILCKMAISCSASFQSYSKYAQCTRYCLDPVPQHPSRSLSSTSLYFWCFLYRLDHLNAYWCALPDWEGQPGITLGGHH